MIGFCSRIALAVAASLTLLSTAPAFSAQRTFVSTSGVNNPACSLVAPCRDFAAAITATSPGGEVIVLDSGGYGKVTITQSVSIIAPPGVYAGVSVSAGDGITVSAGPTDKVVLRGLTVNGQGGLNGIRVTSGNVTNIEDCTVANMGWNGIVIEGGAVVSMARIVIRSNGTAGVQVQPVGGITIGTSIADSLLTNNGSGFNVLVAPFGTVNATVTRVTASHNGGGFHVDSNDAGTITMTVADSIAVENGSYGLYARGTNVTAIVSGSSFAHNSPADVKQVLSSVVLTAGNNAIGGVVDGTLTLNPLR